MLRDLQKFWKAFGSSEEMACCYQLLYMMVIQNAQPGLEIPALVRGTPCPARFPVGADLAGAAAAAMCCGASAAVQSLVQALPALVQVQSLDVSSQPPSLSSPGAKGKFLGCLLLSWPLAIPLDFHKSGETSKAESWCYLHGHYSKLKCVRKAGVGRSLCWCQLSCGGPTYMKWLSLALSASLLAVLQQCFHHWSSTWKHIKVPLPKPLWLHGHTPQVSAKQSNLLSKPKQPFFPLTHASWHEPFLAQIVIYRTC